MLGNQVGKKAFDVSKQLFACTLEMVCCEFVPFTDAMSWFFSFLNVLSVAATTIGCNLEFQNDKNVEMLETMEA